MSDIKSESNHIRRSYGFFIAAPDTVEVPDIEADEKAEVCVTWKDKKVLMTYQEFLDRVFI